jgi:hypothetical protein
MHMWHHVTNHLIISNDKDSNSENRIKLRVRDIFLLVHLLLVYLSGSAVTPSHLQKRPSVAIPSVQGPKLSYPQLHPHIIVQVRQMLSEALQDIQPRDSSVIDCWIKSHFCSSFIDFPVHIKLARSKDF